MHIPLFYVVKVFKQLIIEAEPDVLFLRLVRRNT